MDTKLLVQGTPNPNALKFVLNVPVRTEGNVTYKNIADCVGNPLAQALFEINNHIQDIYFFDNYITITQDGSVDWDELEEKIKSIILEKISDHDPNFVYSEPKTSITPEVESSPELDKINAILDHTVRPALQMDGGDLLCVNLDNNILKVHYQGACGSCPSAAMGTLQAIENILRNEYNPEIVVEMAEAF